MDTVPLVYRNKGIPISELFKKIFQEFFVVFGFLKNRYETNSNNFFQNEGLQSYKYTSQSYLPLSMTRKGIRNALFNNPPPPNPLDVVCYSGHVFHF